MTGMPPVPDDAGPRSFEAQFEEQAQAPIRWKALVKRSLVILFTGIVLYLVAPSVLAVFHSWPRLATLNLVWFLPAVLAEAGHFACTFALQRIALRTKAWFAVITAQLAGNAISLTVPGGPRPEPPSSSGCSGRPGWTRPSRSAGSPPSRSSGSADSSPSRCSSCPWCCSGPRTR